MCVDTLLKRLDEPAVQKKIESLLCDTLLKLLDEPAVQIKIKSLVCDTSSVDNFPLENRESLASNKKNSDFEQENKELKKVNNEMAEFIKRLKDNIFGKDKELSDNSSRIQNLDLQVTKLKRLVESKEAEIKSAIQKVEYLQGQLVTSDKKVNWYREHFSEDIKVQEIYSNLSEATKGSLSGIFKSTTTNGLIACGIQEKNIGNLWEYAKNEVVNGINPDILTITKLFEILFARFTLAFPMYEIQSVSSGDDFDTQLHIKHNSSRNVSGVIESVLLCGYVNTKTGKVVKQSIVKI